jgi:hypothetical protein
VASDDQQLIPWRSSRKRKTPRSREKFKVKNVEHDSVKPQRDPCGRRHI